MMTLKQYLKGMPIGSKIYVNAICLGARDIKFLRRCIENKILLPDTETLKRNTSEEGYLKFISGECIFPQMDYTLNKVIK